MDTKEIKMAKLEIHRSEDRGRTEMDWLMSRHGFSFADYYNPKRTHFGLLRVFNDDIVAPSSGFDTHGHDNMEIVTIMLEGQLEHRDSRGNHGILKAGDVQRMTAGTGIRHSEHNPSKTEPLRLLQIWVFPRERNLEPGYEQKTFSENVLRNHFLPVVSPEKNQETLFIHQDACFSLGHFDSGRTASYKWHHPGNGGYLFVASGVIDFKNETLRQGDAAAMTDYSQIDVRATEPSQLLLIELPLAPAK